MVFVREGLAVNGGMEWDLMKGESVMGQPGVGSRDGEECDEPDTGLDVCGTDGLPLCCLSVW